MTITNTTFENASRTKFEKRCKPTRSFKCQAIKTQAQLWPQSIDIKPKGSASGTIDAPSLMRRAFSVYYFSYGLRMQSIDGNALTLLHVALSGAARVDLRLLSAETVFDDGG